MTAQKHPMSFWSVGLLVFTLILTGAIVAVLVLMSGGKAALAAPTQPTLASATTTPTPAPLVSATTTPTAGDPDFEATSIYLLTAIPPETPARPTGIYEDLTAFFHEGYRMQNVWQELVGGYWAYVAAGARTDDLEQGWIFSRWELPDAAIGEFYRTPQRAGSVHIVAEQNARLTLVSANGTTFYWDIPSQSFVDSLTAVAPTITPPHNPTPTVLPPGTAEEPEGYPGVTPTAAP
jgi:hypothetical protein